MFSNSVTNWRPTTRDLKRHALDLSMKRKMESNSETKKKVREAKIETALQMMSTGLNYFQLLATMWAKSTTLWE
jgi:hypothetical protein